MLTHRQRFRERKVRAELLRRRLLDAVRVQLAGAYGSCVGELVAAWRYGAADPTAAWRAQLIREVSFLLLEDEEAARGHHCRTA